MRERHVAHERFHAREVLKYANVPLGADFHELTTAHVERLLAAADQLRYRKPRNANGSRARYFHDLMQRRAKE